MIGCLFHVSYTVEGTRRRLRRHGWSWITRAVKRRLRGIRCRPELADGCLTVTGLMLEG
ncbi:hypothetical protein [Streptomyces sp. NPDC020965]|uniref:hypothetical protein n=1 Tax=Streptomyces sp. NPDC020965 TaxID=3365105 RepID=UPI0037BD94D2